MELLDRSTNHPTRRNQTNATASRVPVCRSGRPRPLLYLPTRPTQIVGPRTGVPGTDAAACDFLRLPNARAHSYNQGNQVVTPYSTLLGSTGRLPLQIHDGTGKDGRDRYTMSAGDPQKRSSEVTNTTTRGNWPWYRLYRWSGIAPRIPRVPQVACRGRVSYGR